MAERELSFYIVLATTASLIFSIVLTVPLVGALVRYRVNYCPKAIQLEPENGSQVRHTGPVVTGYFAMLKRVYKLEVSRESLVPTSQASDEASIGMGWTLQGPKQVSPH